MYFTSDEQFTKHGFFEVNGQKTFSKYEAWQIAKQQGLLEKDIKFIYNDEKMDSLDWSVEPTESLQELYRRRAQQLRDKYDHVVLMYSGGIDSHVVLNTFVRNNIKLDEIICAGNLEFQQPESKINQEVIGKAIPYLDTIDLAKLGAKYTFVDIGHLELEQFEHEYNFENFMYYYNGPLSPWYMALRSHFFKLKLDHHVELSNNGKTICYIWGYDKPNLFYEDGNWCFKFTDSVTEYAVRPYNSKINFGGPLKNFYDEPFFVTADLPELTIKQCHLLVKTLKEITSPKDVRLCEVWQIANTGPFVPHPSGEGFDNGRWLKKKELERIVYPDENVDHFGDDKVRGSVMFTARDRWFFRSQSNPRNKLVTKWKQMLRKEEGYFKYNIEGFPVNSLTFYSKPYIIDKI